MATIASVSPSELIKTATFGLPVITELNTRCIKVTGTTEAGGPITGSLVINAGPALKLRRSDNLPLLYFEDTTGATRYGYIRGGAAEMTYLVDGGTGVHRFLVATSEMLRVDSTGVVTNAGIDVNAGGVRIGGNGGQLSLIDTSTSGSDFHDVLISFYGQGVSMVSPGVRSGFIGYNSATTLEVNNDVPNGGVRLEGNGSGTIALATGASGDITMTTGTGGNIILNAAGVITFDSGGAERGRVVGALLWGKTTASSSVPGVALFEGGTIYSTTATNTVPNMLIRHNTDATDAAYIQFANAAGGIVSEIDQDASSPTGITITHATTTAKSDYRLKDDLGPMVAALDRVNQLQPKHLAWKDTGREFDGFIAHELAAVVPDAVYGEKDAVYDAVEAERMGVEPGDIKPQSIDTSPLIPLLTAAVQELTDRVAALEAP